MTRETIEYDGIQWHRYPESEKRNHRVYFQHHFNEKSPVYLHRYKYEKLVGAIPEGHVIHHIDENPLNNDIENLTPVDASLHMSDHSKKSEWVQSRQLKKHLKRIRHLTVEWHKSKEGREWHKEHGKKTWSIREKLKKRCDECGKVYFSYWKRSRHCGANCYARYYRRERMK